MNVKLSVPAVSASKHPRRQEDDLRVILERNAGQFVLAFGGACVIKVSPNPGAVALTTATTGHVKFWVGGVQKLEETIPFQVDWGERLLTVEVPKALPARSD